MSAEIIPFFKQFDPLAREAEERYDRVVTRFNMLGARLDECRRTSNEVEQHQPQEEHKDKVDEAGAQNAISGRYDKFYYLNSESPLHTTSLPPCGIVLILRVRHAFFRRGIVHHGVKFAPVFRGWMYCSL